MSFKIYMLLAKKTFKTRFILNKNESNLCTLVAIFIFTFSITKAQPTPIYFPYEITKNGLVPGNDEYDESLIRAEKIRKK